MTPSSNHRRPHLGITGGLLAVAAAVAGIVMPAARGSTFSGLTALTLAFVLVGGVVALVRPRLIEALAVADVLVAIAVLIEVFGRLGLMYLPSLVVLVLATMRAEEQEVAEEQLAPQVIRPMLAWQWEKLMTNPPPAPVGVQDVPAASAEALRRAG